MGDIEGEPFCGFISDRYFIDEKFEILGNCGIKIPIFTSFMSNFSVCAEFMLCHREICSNTVLAIVIKAVLFLAEVSNS